jgi:hypothetical protein
MPRNPARPLKYVGDHTRFTVGVPQRDLSGDEVAALDVPLRELVESGDYRPDGWRLADEPALRRPLSAFVRAQRSK